MEGPTFQNNFQLGANFLYHLCALIQFNVDKRTQKELAKHVQNFFVRVFLLSLSRRLGRILKPIWAVTRQATCNCKPQRPPTSTDFLQGSSLYISTTIMWGRGGATFQNPHFLFRRLDKWHVPVEGSRKIAKLTFIFNSALMWRQMQKTLALHCFTKSTTCSACSGVKLFLRPQFLHWVCGIVHLEKQGKKCKIFGRPAGAWKFL